MIVDNRPTNTSIEEQEMRVSPKMLARMRWYLFALDEFTKQGKTVASSQEIAEKVGINSGLVRKDLCHFGGFGRPSVGYNIAYLQSKIRDILKVNRVKRVAWIGVDGFTGNPLLVKRFGENKCDILALFDPNASKVGQQISGLEVMPFSDIEKVVAELSLDSAVITSIDEKSAQEAVELLAKGGTKAILNLSKAVIVAPPDTAVRNLDIVSELITLSAGNPE